MYKKIKNNHKLLVDHKEHLQNEYHILYTLSTILYSKAEEKPGIVARQQTRGVSHTE